MISLNCFARITGSFFQGKFYYGEIPLHFSHALTQGYLFSPDHNLPRMYEHIQFRAKVVLEQELMVALLEHEYNELAYYIPPMAKSTSFLAENGQLYENLLGYFRIHRPIIFPSVHHTNISLEVIDRLSH
jgi:hypothetical protein